LPKDYDAIGGQLLTEKHLIITFKRRVEPEDYVAFNVNLTNVTALINGKIVRHDLRNLYHVHRAYEEKRRMQKLSKTRPRIARRLIGEVF